MIYSLNVGVQCRLC